MKIGVVSSSSAVSEKPVRIGAAEFEKQGFDIVFSPHCFEQNRFLAGTDAQRIADLHAFFADDSIDCILEAGGGYGSSRLLDGLDYDLIRRHKKPLVGLSDSTALQNALIAKADLVCPSGFLLKKRFSDYEIPPTLSDFFAGKELNYELNGAFEASGRLLGGCLSLVVALLGTPYLPDMTGAILVLEDIGEEPYAIDRMLQHLASAGVFKAVSAVVFGQFVDCLAKDSADGTIQDVLDEWEKRIEKPVFTNLNYGHQAYSAVVPFGAVGSIKNGTLTVSGKDEQ